MNMLTAIILSITIISVIVASTAAAIRADARSRLDSPMTRVMATRTSTQPRRRVAGVRYPVGLPSPQYLPSLERARILRTRTLEPGGVTERLARKYPMGTTFRRRPMVRMPVSGAGPRLGGRKVLAGDQGSVDPAVRVTAPAPVEGRDGV